MAVPLLSLYRNAYEWSNPSHFVLYVCFFAKFVKLYLRVTSIFQQRQF